MLWNIAKLKHIVFEKCADLNSGLHFVQHELAQVVINLLNAKMVYPSGPVLNDKTIVTIAFL